MSENPTYQQQLSQEAELWGSEAERMARIVPPDWRYHRNLRHNVIVHGPGIEELLGEIQPGMKALELGCASGWLTLALAQRGADATGMDLSEKSLAVGRAYYESIRHEVKGAVTYAPVDMNYLQLPAATYDVIVVKGVLHHLIHLQQVIQEIHKALKPGGLLWVDDTNGEESLPSVLIAGFFALLLPTETSYADKFRALLRFGLRTPSRVKASIEVHGLSPFEGVGREHDWLQMIDQHFKIEHLYNLPAFTGYVSAQWTAPDRVAVPVLKAMRAVDRLLMRLKLVRGTGVVLFARKV